eukprot:9236752-Pyramimonas_sp.AAC.1
MCTTLAGGTSVRTSFAPASVTRTAGDSIVQPTIFSHWIASDNGPLFREAHGSPIVDSTKSWASLNAAESLLKGMASAWAEPPSARWLVQRHPGYLRWAPCLFHPHGCCYGLTKGSNFPGRKSLDLRTMRTPFVRRLSPRSREGLRNRRLNFPHLLGRFRRTRTCACVRSPKKSTPRLAGA